MAMDSSHRVNGSLVSMAMDHCSQRVNGENLVSAFIFYRIFFILAGNEDNYNIPNFSQIRPRTAKYAALERLKKFP